MDDARTKQMIPYPPEQIRIQKRSGRSTASAFCSSRRARKSERAPVTRNDTALASLQPNGDTTAASLSSVASTGDSDFSDTISVVSELSDLSVMSLSHSFSDRTSLMEGNSSINNNIHVGRRRANHVVVPLVHGQQCESLDQQARLKQLMKKMSFLQYEVNTYEKQAQQSSSQKSVVAKLKEENFQLQRESVNLRSQVDSLQRSLIVNEKLRGSSCLEDQGGTEADSLVTTAGLEKQLGDLHQMYEGEKQKCADLSSEKASLLQKIVVISEARAEHEASANRLSQTLSEKEIELRNVVTRSLDQAKLLSQMKSDVESATKARDWLSQQLATAQENQAVLKQEVTRLKQEASDKSAAIFDLEIKVGSAEALLEEERLKYQAERNDFTQKLKRIEEEVSEQESIMTSIQDEKNLVISELSERLSRTTASSSLPPTDELRENVRALEDKLKSIRHCLDDRQRALESVVAERDQATCQLHLVEGQLVLLTETNRSLEMRAGELEAARLRCEEQLSAVGQREESLSAQLEDKGAQLSEAQELLEKSTGFIEKLKEDLHSRTVEYSQQLSQMAKEIKELKNSEDLAICEFDKNRENAQLMAEQRARISKLEAELDSKGRSLDELVEITKRNEEDICEKDAVIENISMELNFLRGERTALAEKLSRSSAELSERSEQNARLRSEVGELSERLEELRSRTPEPDVEDVRKAYDELRTEVMRLAMVESEVLELRQENEQLARGKGNLNEKILEVEKAYSEEIEKLAEEVSRKDEIIMSMKGDIETVESDLCQTRHLLSLTDRERARLNSDHTRRVQDMEDELLGYDATKKMLLEKQSSLKDMEEESRALAEENESLLANMETMASKLDSLEHENARLRRTLEDNIAAEEELKDLQSQRIARLESFVSEYEKELEESTASISGLQRQIIALEDANGRLQSECLLTETLREQLLQLQRDVKVDTGLRQDLARSIDLLKTNLAEETAAHKGDLRAEREAHAKTTEWLGQLQQSNAELKQKLSALQTKYEASLQDLVGLESRFFGARSPAESGDESGRQSRHFMEETQRNISYLEDHVGTLKFNLEQKCLELRDAQAAQARGEEKLGRASERHRELERCLRSEIAAHKQTIESVCQERDAYKMQVRDMNTALKGSLDHIKQLRSQASYPSSPSPLDEADVTLRSATPPARNLASLQTCLTSLKLEMALLQKRLAPGENNSLTNANAANEANSATKTSHAD